MVWVLHRLGQAVASRTSLLATSANLLRPSASAAAAMQQAQQLCVLDPLLLLEPHRLRAREEEREAGGSQAYVSLEVSPDLCSSVQRGGEMQLGDMDDPQSHWSFGEKAELFQYRFSGSHTVVSGWTCVVSADVLRSVQDGRLNPGTSWTAFSKLTKGQDRLLYADAVEGGLTVPMLFAGRLMDCPSASVFKLSKAGQLPHGLLLSNDFESVDD